MKPTRGLLRPAFSLVELLAVSAIIGMLIALVVPAMQRVRAAAANSQCVNNMKQIGLGLQQYHDVFRHFPSGNWTGAYEERLLADGRLAAYWTGQVGGPWSYDILPYIGLESLWKLRPPNSLTLGIPKFRHEQEDDGVRSAEYLDAWKAGAPIVVCPAALRPQRGSYGDTYPITSYVGVQGKFGPPAWEMMTRFSKEDGVFPQVSWDLPYYQPSVRLADITDGESNTLMVGERGAIGTWQGGGWDELLYAIWSDEPLTGRGCAGYRFSPGDDFLTNGCHFYHFWSFHSGGGNWLLCDGSVRFMQYSAGTTVIPLMATIAGGEDIPPLDGDS